MKLSVCIPVYKVEHFVEKCARSMFEQTMESGLELIFVDDCSPDESVSIIERVLCDYPKRRMTTHIIRFPANQGVHHARMAAIEYSTGDYLMFCDSDDWYSPDMCEKMYLAARQGNADIVACGMRAEYAETHKDYGWYVSDAIPDFIYQMCGDWRHASMCNKCYRRDLVVGGLGELAFTRTEDLVQNLLIFKNVSRIVTLTEPLYHYRRHVGSVSSAISERALEDFRLVAEYIEKEVGIREASAYRCMVRANLLMELGLPVARVKDLLTHFRTGWFVWSRGPLKYRLVVAIGGLTVRGARAVVWLNRVMRGRK